MSFGPLIAVWCQAYISELAHAEVIALAPSELVRVAETAIDGHSEIPATRSA
jgi:hypothetical protein